MVETARASLTSVGLGYNMVSSMKCHWQSMKNSFQALKMNIKISYIFNKITYKMTSTIKIGNSFYIFWACLNFSCKTFACFMRNKQIGSSWDLYWDRSLHFVCPREDQEDSCDSSFRGRAIEFYSFRKTYHFVEYRRLILIILECVVLGENVTDRWGRGCLSV